MTNAGEQRFYEERDLRSKSYGLAEAAASIPVGLRVGAEAARSRVGQVLTLALVNMLARVHRRIEVDVPDAALVAQSLVPAASLRDALVATIRAINPYCRIEPLNDASTRVAIGCPVTSPNEWALGVSGARGAFSQNDEVIEDDSASLLGAGMAACLAASALFRLVHGIPISASVVSCWDGTEGPSANRGPSAVQRLDVGRVLLVGAGAVANGLAYWTREVGVDGAWAVVDRDFVKLHNTGRSLLMGAEDAGWKDREPRRKVDLIHAAIGATPHFAWFDELDFTSGETFDLVLPLANERNVRSVIGQRFDPVLLHAATSPSWEAQLHRHVGGVDDCISCRMRHANEDPVAAFSCSGGSLPKHEDRAEGDAALPFLSAAAGLLLLAALVRLQAGQLTEASFNQLSIDFLSSHRVGSRNVHACKADCVNIIPASQRRILGARSRWIDVLNGPDSENFKVR